MLTFHGTSGCGRSIVIETFIHLLTLAIYIPFKASALQSYHVPPPLPAPSPTTTTNQRHVPQPTTAVTVFSCYQIEATFRRLPLPRQCSAAIRSKLHFAGCLYRDSVQLLSDRSYISQATFTVTVFSCYQIEATFRRLSLQRQCSVAINSKS